MQKKKKKKKKKKNLEVSPEPEGEYKSEREVNKVRRNTNGCEFIRGEI